MKKLPIVSQSTTTGAPGHHGRSAQPRLAASTTVTLRSHENKGKAVKMTTAQSGGGSCETAEALWHDAWNVAVQVRMATITTVSAKRGCILLVEDRDDVRQGLAQLLEFNGFLVEEARDGRAALTLLQCANADIALLVLDLMLPGSVSGRDIRARMLTDPECADIPTIVVTASEIDAPGRAGLCPQAWLEKPFRFDQLLELVKRFVVPETEAGSITQIQ